jgi:glutathione synthase/RimK-type ligase-like ATP-grasp enzyme
MLSKYGFPIPRTCYVDAKRLSEGFGPEDFADFVFPVIVKPVDGAHGNGVKMGLRDVRELTEKLTASLEEYPRMIVQEQVA